MFLFLAIGTLLCGYSVKWAIGWVILYLLFENK